jgi:co-chaperonin GroES (HSP10)
MIIPCGHRVLVLQESYDEHDEVFKSARSVGIEIVKDKQVRYQASVDKGVILSIGPTAWKDFGGEKWAEVGDTVIFAKNAGKHVEDPDSPSEIPTHVVLNDEDIIAVVRKTK